MNKTFDLLVNKIHPEGNPWKGWDGDGHIHHFTAWGSEHPWFAQAIKQMLPRLIIEVGSFLGGSANHMAGCLKKNELKDSAILCVDTWLAENVLWSRPEERKLLQLQHGRPTFYNTFMNNVKDKRNHDCIVPLSMPSLSAARYLSALGITAEFIYIDGSHEKGDVYRDIAAYWELLKPGGRMMIDDWTPVFQAVADDTTQFAIDRELKITTNGDKAVLCKP